MGKFTAVTIDHLHFASTAEYMGARRHVSHRACAAFQSHRPLICPCCSADLTRQCSLEHPIYHLLHGFLNFQSERFRSSICFGGSCYSSHDLASNGIRRGRDPIQAKPLISHHDFIHILAPTRPVTRLDKNTRTFQEDYAPLLIVGSHHDGSPFLIGTRRGR